jgi:hypothetical protein
MTQIAHIHDASTGETIERPLTADELELIANNAKYGAEKKKFEEAKEAARAAVLAKLGLTADEAAALLG